MTGFPGGSEGFSDSSDDQESTYNQTCMRPGFYLWVRKIPWRKKLQPTPVFLPGESPWIEELSKLQSMRSQRVRHNWVIKHSTDHYRSTFNVVLVQSISSKSVSKKILRKYVNFECNSNYHFTDKITQLKNDYLIFVT